MYLNTLEHRCAMMPSLDIQISCEPGLLPSETWRWALCVERKATEQDLQENQHLEEVGYGLWSLAVGIRHCPYCGVLLPGERCTYGLNSGPNSSAAFRLMDYREWTVTVSDSVLLQEALGSLE
jgi:hypothetical protein